MTPGIQTTLCYIRERWIIQTPTLPSFLIMKYPRAGSNFLTFTYYLIIFKTSGDSVMVWVAFFFPLLFNGLVTVRSLQCIWYMISTVACMSSEGYQIDSVCNWRCTQTLPAWISVHVCAVLEFIYWEGTRDIYLPKTSVLMGTLGWECSKCSTAKQHTVTHRLIICKDFCSSCLAPDCMKFIFKIT